MQRLCVALELDWLSSLTSRNYSQMTKKVPQVNNENLAIDDAERKTYWCNFAMVRADYQSKGVAKALFELAFKEVSTQVNMRLRG